MPALDQDVLDRLTLAGREAGRESIDTTVVFVHFGKVLAHHRLVLTLCHVQVLPAFVIGGLPVPHCLPMGLLGFGDPLLVALPATEQPA